MLIAAVAFYFIFSHKPYIDPAAAQVPCLHSFINMVDVRDIYDDVKENFVDPIPVPRLPGRRSQQEKIEDKNRELEVMPLLEETRRGSDDERVRRLGNGEASLILISIRDLNNEDIENGAHLVSENNEDTINTSSSQSDDSSQIRERKLLTSDPEQ